MQYIKPSFVPLAFLCFCALWLGCSKSEKKETCLTCISKPPELIKDIYLLGEKFSVGIYKTKKHSNFIFSKVRNESNETDQKMRQIIQDLDTKGIFTGLLSDGYVPANYNVYSNYNIRQSAEISAKEIKAISLIMYKNKGLHHFLFVKDGERISLDERFNAVTDGLNIIDKYLIFENLINDGHTIVSLVTMVTPSYMKVINEIKTKNKLRKVLSQASSTHSRQIVIGDPECDPEICTPIQDTPGECKELIGGMGCVEKEDEETICPLGGVATAFNRVVDFMEMWPVFYTFKDSVLLQSSNGLDVIDKFYKAGEFIQANIGELELEYMWEYVELLHNKASIILQETESDDILFDEVEQSDALNLIEDLRSIDSTSEWQGLLDWLEALVNQFADRTVSEVYQYLIS